MWFIFSKNVCIILIAGTIEYLENKMCISDFCVDLDQPDVNNLKNVKK